MANRFVEATLHTGEVAYLHARGLLELDYPVIVKPVSERYSYVVARVPYEDDSNLFYRVWQPGESMRLLAAHVFGDWYTGSPQNIADDTIIWEAIRKVHQFASAAAPEAQSQGSQYINRVANYLSEQSGTYVPPVALAAVTEIYRWQGALVFPHFLTASVAPATLLLMLGVPRERVAVFGMYYQDPTVYYRSNSDWHAGFLSGTPYYAVMGIYIRERWTPVDFTLLASGPHYRLQAQPHPHLRHSSLGNHPQDGAPLVIDFAHPYTMVFAPPKPGDESISPLLTRIPLLRLFSW